MRYLTNNRIEFRKENTAIGKMIFEAKSKQSTVGDCLIVMLVIVGLQ